MSKRTISLLFLVLSSCIWGLTFLVTKNTLGQSGPFTLTALRFIVAVLTLLPFAWKQGFRFNLTFKPAFIRYGLMGVTLTYLLQNVGLVFTTAANAACCMWPSLPSSPCSPTSSCVRRCRQYASSALLYR